MAEKLWQIMLPVACITLFLALLLHHWQIITAPVPLDLYEGAMPLITGMIADGINPYTLPFQPQAVDLYPPLYNILVAPLSKLFGNSFLLHRSVSGGFIFIAVFLCGLATWRNCGSLRHSLAASALLYAALLFYGTPVASTNAIGVALFLTSVFIPWFYGFSVTSLISAAVFALLAFYSKQYFALGMALVCLYTFLYISMWRAIFLGILYAGLLLLSLTVVHITSPYYLDNTLFSPSATMINLHLWSTLFLQLRTFLSIYSGLLIVVLVAAATVADRGLLYSLFRLSREGLAGPLLAVRRDFFYFCLAGSTVFIVFGLGRNPGNYMTYLFQLMSPFLLIAGFSSISRLPGKLKVFCPLVLISFWQSYAILPKDFSTNMQNWHEMDRIVEEADQIFATQMLTMALLRKGKDVYQNGYTFYFPLASHKPSALVKTKKDEQVGTIWLNYITSLYRKIERKEFDLILISKWEMKGIFQHNPPPFQKVSGRQFLRQHYAVDRKIKLSMTDRYGGGTYEIQIWRPRN